MNRLRYSRAFVPMYLSIHRRLLGTYDAPFVSGSACDAARLDGYVLRVDTGGAVEGARRLRARFATRRKLPGEKLFPGLRGSLTSDRGETKPSEAKRNETKRNTTKRTGASRNKPKTNQRKTGETERFFYATPMSPTSRLTREYRNEDVTKWEISVGNKV